MSTVTDHFVLFSIHQSNNKCYYCPVLIFACVGTQRAFLCYSNQQGLDILAWYQSFGGLNLEVEEISRNIEEMKMLEVDLGCEGSPAETKYKFEQG